MLKEMTLRKKKVPIPVPLKNMAQAYQWIEKTWLTGEIAITSMKLDSKELSEIERKSDKIILDAKSQLEVQIETPQELAIQTLDVIRDLSYQIEKSLKLAAVKCWEKNDPSPFNEIKEIEDDLFLTLQLIEQINGIFDYSVPEMAPVNGLAKLVSRFSKELSEARNNKDWKRVAMILLNKIESLLKELVTESETLQINILSLGKEDLRGKA